MLKGYLLIIIIVVLLFMYFIDWLIFLVFYENLWVGWNNYDYVGFKFLNKMIKLFFSYGVVKVGYVFFL